MRVGGRLIFVIVCNVHNYAIKVRVNCLVKSGLCFLIRFLHVFVSFDIFMQGNKE